MPGRKLAALLLAALAQLPAAARDLLVEIEVQHVVGATLAEMESWIASPELVIEATYSPRVLIEGVTASRSRTMPIGSQLVPIPELLTLRGAHVERFARGVRFRVPDTLKGGTYTLGRAALSVPVAEGFGRPRPGIRTTLLDQPDAQGSHQRALRMRDGALDLGMRVRYAWEDAAGPRQLHVPGACSGIVALDADRYAFLADQHSLAALVPLARVISSNDPPARPVAGQRSFQLRPPLPAALEGGKLSRNHLVRVALDGGRTLEALSVYAEKVGEGRCVRSIHYTLMFADGMLFDLDYGRSAYQCGATQSDSRSASWLDDGTLHRFANWRAPSGPQCPSQGMPPDPAAVESLMREAQDLRREFLRHEVVR